MLEAVNAGRAINGLPPFTAAEYAEHQAERQLAEAEAAPRRAAIDRGEWCNGCGQPIDPGQAVAQVRDSRHPDRWAVGTVVAWCMACYTTAFEERVAHWRSRGGVSTTWGGWLENPTDELLHQQAALAVLRRPPGYLGGGLATESPCAGCGRMVVHLPTWRHDWVACSPRCRRRVYRGNVWGRSTCDGCGEAFDASRADARYCSSACRQRAYRQRRA